MFECDKWRPESNGEINSRMYISSHSGLSVEMLISNSLKIKIEIILYMNYEMSEFCYVLRIRYEFCSDAFYK